MDELQGLGSQETTTTRGARAHRRRHGGWNAGLVSRLKALDLGRLLRYGATSVISLGISEAVLLVLSDKTALGAASAALIANLAGTGPSYLLSRYWIWPEADRRRVGRQVVLYWVISLISMGLSSVTLGVVADHVPEERMEHVLLLGAAYLAISLILWAAKYVSYRSIIFTGEPSGARAA